MTHRSAVFPFMTHKRENVNINFRLKSLVEVGLRRAYDSFLNIHGGVYGPTLFWQLQERVINYHSDFEGTNRIGHDESNEMVHFFRKD